MRMLFMFSIVGVQRSAVLPRNRPRPLLFPRVWGSHLPSAGTEDRPLHVLPSVTYNIRGDGHHLRNLLVELNSEFAASPAVLTQAVSLPHRS
jgi:hypothetical protein